MGEGMARSLWRAGIEVRAWNRTYEKLDDLADEGQHMHGGRHARAWR
jgi:3-hydroxyisobutyrate dehydrogenase-like beta-hydroxyacid dehydrogenase